MHGRYDRDKGGAASVAGLMKTIALLKPKGIREAELVWYATAWHDACYDEIIIGRAGVRVRIGNTAAEGRWC